jgi:hypothetical protein
MDEVRELHTVFQRGDMEQSGIVGMQHFMECLQKMQKVDETGILKRAYSYFRRSLAVSKLSSFFSFKAIIELLIPSLSSSDVDNLLEKFEKSRTQQPTAASLKKKGIASRFKMTAMKSRAVEAWKLEEMGGVDLDVDPPEGRRPMTVQSAYELREVFDVLAPSGDLVQQTFYDTMEGALNHNEKIEFYQTYVKRSRFKKGLETTKMGLQLAQYSADFSSFQDMSIPAGYSMPDLPDPEKHTATPEQLWAYIYTREPVKEQGHQKVGKGLERFRKLPKIEPRYEKAADRIQYEKAGQPLPKRVYDSKEVQECRHLMHHVVIPEDSEKTRSTSAMA